MNWVPFKDLHSYLCFHGAVVACQFITQMVGGSKTPFLKKKFYRCCRFFRIHLGKTRLMATDPFTVVVMEAGGNPPFPHDPPMITIRGYIFIVTHEYAL